MEDEFDGCLRGRGIIKFPKIKSLAKEEIKTAKEDLKEAKNRFKAGKFKYATTNAYYALFHAARALLYSVGYREKSHRCLLIAIEKLFVQEKLLDSKFLEFFEEATGLREAADYGRIYSKIGAKKAIRNAEKFLQVAREILKG